MTSEQKGVGVLAFPRPRSEGEYSVHDAQEGMTLRDYFAAKAMQALLHPSHFIVLSEMTPKGGSHVAAVAREAYWTADAMLAARGQP